MPWSVNVTPPNTVLELTSRLAALARDQLGQHVYQGASAAKAPARSLTLYARQRRLSVLRSHRIARIDSVRRAAQTNRYLLSESPQ